MRRFISAGAATALMVVPAVLSVPSSTQAAAAERAPAKVTTEFAMKAAGYGTRVQGGAVPAQSGTTAYQVIGCTNKAGLARTNEVAEAELPGVGTVSGVKTRVDTIHHGATGRVSVVSRHDVAEVRLAKRLTLRAVSSTATVWHDRKGFHRKVETAIGSIRADGRTYALPTPSSPIHIPGVATVFVGDHHGRATKDGAYAAGNAVKVVLEPSRTVVRIAHSAATMNRGLKVGRFRGQAHGTQVSALDSNLRSGPLPLSYMPCQGTGGKVLEKAVAGVDLGGQLVVGAVRNRQMGKQTEQEATGFEESTVASVTLGPLRINAIKARANVTRHRDGRVTRNADGTTLGSVEYDGEEYALPDPGTAIEIPGVGLVRIETNLVERSRRGVEVTALRITLLEGSGAKVDIANARLEIKPVTR